MPQDQSYAGVIATYTVSDPHPFAFGRNSVLYKASSGDQTVCVKVFRATLESPDEFFAEIAARKVLVHPNILPILDSNEGQRAALPFLVLPYCKAGNLRSLLSGRSFLRPQMAMPLLRDVAAAIDFAHQGAMVHGDIKPENILLSDDRTRALLTDFGVSKHFPVEERISTRVGEAKDGGSTAYMSPEQISDGHRHFASDIYSFATVAFELLTGALPVDVGVPPFRQMLAKIEGNLLHPADLNPQLSKAACDALRWGLALKASDRPTSASALCDALDASVLETGALPRAPAEVKTVVLLLHGIRTHATWQEMVAGVLQRDPHTRVIPLRFGYFDVARFISPLFTRPPAIESILRRVRTARSAYPQCRFIVIAHSFGTYAIGDILREQADIALEGLILCGAILPSEYRWELVRHRIKHPIINDCGTKDIWPVLAQSATWGYGASGTFGFGNVGVRDRFHSYSHSDFFNSDFVERFWVPYVRDGTIVDSEWDLKRPPPSWGMSALSMIPLKLVWLALILAAGWWAVWTLMRR